MSEYTKEQVDQMIADAKVGLLSEDEVTRRVTIEADRRVESGIQKGLDTQRKKWEEEYSTKAKMTAEEIAKKEFEEQLNGVTAKEKEINKRANMLDAKDMLSEADIPKAYYDKFITMLVNDDVETTKTNVSNFVEMFNKTKEEIETKVKSENSKIPKPNTGGSEDVVTKDTFNKMGFRDKLAFKQSNPQLYSEFIK